MNITIWQFINALYHQNLTWSWITFIIWILIIINWGYKYVKKHKKITFQERQIIYSQEKGVEKL